MAGIGDDIKEVFQELGTVVEVIKPNGDVFQETMDFELNNLSSSFMTNFVIDASFSYDTNLNAGDVVKAVDSGLYYLAAALNRPYFEDMPVVTETKLYKCNYWGMLKERTQTRVDYSQQVTWADKLSEMVPVLLTGQLGGGSLSEKDHGIFYDFTRTLHISGHHSPQVGDRFETEGGTKFRLDAVEPDKLNNVSMCSISLDERE